MQINLKTTCVLITLGGTIAVSVAQDSQEHGSGETTTLLQAAPLRPWSAGIGVGIYSFFGDIGKVENNTIRSSFSHFRKGLHLNGERRFGSMIGISAGFLTGKLSRQERSLSRNLNFETNIYQLDLNLAFHFDNDVLMNRSAKFTPIFSAGIGYLLFNPHGDLENANGVTYNYWSDGTLRNTPESDTSGAEIQRDYVYETELDSTGAYKHSTLVIPLYFGLKLKLGDRFDVRIGASYTLTLSDDIDNLKDGNGFFANDRYLYSNAGIHYHLGGGDDPETKERKKEKESYKNFDFTAIDNSDSDGDGVPDVKDQCPDSPAGVKTDSKGCPLDSDKDGVPDYRDKEPNSKPGSVVNAEGIIMTDQMFGEQAQSDSLAMDRQTLDAIYARLSEKNIAGGGPHTSSRIPAELQPGDKNKDGFISSEEVTAVIDDFFEGSSPLTIDAIYRLIDYFFEQ